MRYAFIFIVLFIPLFINGQVLQEMGNEIDTVHVKHNCNYSATENVIPIYHIDSFIIKFLERVFYNDTLCTYYRRNFTAYNFSINKQTDFYSIEIRPVYLDQLRQVDYFGAFKLKERLFLCWGCRPNELFSATSSDSLKIGYNKNIEMNDYYLGGDVPSLKELINCKGLKLYFIITASCN
jgi:hypothetical protein